MKYEILYTKSAVKDIKKLDIVSKGKLKKKLEDLSKNPYSKSKHLTDSKLGTYRYRIGNYKIIFNINKKSIVILRIRHRKEVYKK